MGTRCAFSAHFQMAVVMRFGRLIKESLAGASILVLPLLLTTTRQFQEIVAARGTVEIRLRGSTTAAWELETTPPRRAGSGSSYLVSRLRLDKSG